MSLETQTKQPAPTNPQMADVVAQNAAIKLEQATNAGQSTENVSRLFREQFNAISPAEQSKFFRDVQQQLVSDKKSVLLPDLALIDASQNRSLRDEHNNLSRDKVAAEVHDPKASAFDREMAALLKERLDLGDANAKQNHKPVPVLSDRALTDFRQEVDFHQHQKAERGSNRVVHGEAVTPEGKAEAAARALIQVHAARVGMGNITHMVSGNEHSDTSKLVKGQDTLLPYEREFLAQLNEQVKQGGDSILQHLNETFIRTGMKFDKNPDGSVLITKKADNSVVEDGDAPPADSQVLK